MLNTGPPINPPEPRLTTCRDCDGHGRAGTTECVTCEGYGQVEAGLYDENPFHDTVKEAMGWG